MTADENRDEYVRALGNTRMSTTTPGIGFVGGYRRPSAAIGVSKDFCPR